MKLVLLLIIVLALALVKIQQEYAVPTKQLLAYSGIVLTCLIGAMLYYFKHYRINKVRNLPSDIRHKTLCKLHELISEASIKSKTKPFIMYGTLLGQVRENDIICWDFDLDYGIKEREIGALRRAVIDLIQRKRKYRTFKLDDAFIDTYFCDGKMFKVVDKTTDLNLDVVAMNHDKVRKTTNRIYNRQLLTYYFKEKIIDFKYKDVFPLQKITFLGKLTYIPANPKLMLKSWYGSKYMTPDRTCDCHRCTLKKEKQEKKEKEEEKEEDEIIAEDDQVEEVEDQDSEEYIELENDHST